jgi:putative endonuclease
MICSYIIYFPELNSYYIGFIKEPIQDNINKHHSSFYGNNYSSKESDWELFHFIEFVSVAQAMKIEKHVKKMKSIVTLKTYNFIQPYKLYFWRNKEALKKLI